MTRITHQKLDTPPRRKPARTARAKTNRGAPQRAIIDGHYATIIDGRRIITFYKSGQPIKGKLQ